MTTKSQSSCCDGGAEPAQDLREVVKERYGQAVRSVLRGARSSCCGSSTATGLAGTDPITRDLYANDQTAGLPEEALKASFGCGNKTIVSHDQGPRGILFVRSADSTGSRIARRGQARQPLGKDLRAWSPRQEDAWTHEKLVYAAAERHGPAGPAGQPGPGRRQG